MKPELHRLWDHRVQDDGDFLVKVEQVRIVREDLRRLVQAGGGGGAGLEGVAGGGGSRGGTSPGRRIGASLKTN